MDQLVQVRMEELACVKNSEGSRVRVEGLYKLGQGASVLARLDGTWL